MKKGLVYLFAATLLVSCGGEENTDEADNSGGGSIIGNMNPEDDGTAVNNNVETSSKIEGMETTSIEYFDLTHNFGNVFYPSDNKYTFKFKNTGNAPLVIDKATASCGCTIILTH